MSQTWSVIINGKDPATFDPDVYGTDPGQPLIAEIGDLVCWNNQTSDVHQLEVMGSDGKVSFTTKEIEAFKPSSPGYVTQTTDESDGTISYSCSKHAGENGKITIVVVAP